MYKRHVVLDPAPAAELPDELYSAVDILTPNEVEIEMMVGIRPSSPQEAADAAKILQSRGVNTVIVTLGSEGVFCASGDRAIYLPAFDVDAIDTVGSGDAFNGGLAVAIAEGLEIDEALEWGAAAGALSTTRPGAAGSMPDRDELTSLISSNR